MQRLSKSCHFMHLMQNRCSRILPAQGGSRPGGEAGGGVIIQLEVGGACHKEFHYFSSHIEKVDCAYCNFFFCSSPDQPVNNLGSFPAEVSSLLISQSSGQRCSITPAEETLTHRNTPCLRHHLLFLPPVLPSALHPHSILSHFISRPSPPPSQPLSLPLARLFLYFSAVLLLFFAWPLLSSFSLFLFSFFLSSLSCRSPSFPFVVLQKSLPASTSAYQLHRLLPILFLKLSRDRRYGTIFSFFGSMKPLYY